MRITSEGKKVLGQNLDKIDMKFLERYPSYVEFKNRRGTKSKDGNNGNESLMTRRRDLLLTNPLSRHIRHGGKH